MLRLFTTLLLSGSLSLIAFADDSDELFSGPQAGEQLTPLRVTLAYGEDLGETVDLVELAGDKPALLVIVNGANRPAAGLTRSLMNYAEIHEQKLFAGVVYLDADLSAAGRYLRQAVAWWGVGPRVGVSVDGAEGPGSWGLNRNVNLTILVAQNGRVLSNFALIQPSLTDGPRILADVAELVGGRVPTTAEMTFLSVPTRKRGNARWRPGPSDVKLRRLICDAIAAADDEQAQAAAAAVDRYVNGNKRRQTALAAAVSSLLSRKGYTEIRDIPVVTHLKRWREQYGRSLEEASEKGS